MKYVVLKIEDIPDKVARELNKVLTETTKKRALEGKKTNNTYFVINADESYADEIREIIKREHGECEV